MLYKTFFKLAALGFIYFPISLWAQNVRAFETPWNIGSLKKKLEATLNKIDTNGFDKEQKTSGFTHRYTNGLFSYYDYDIYIGRIFADKKQTILRIEGDSGDVHTFSRIFQLEKILKKEDSYTSEKGQVYTPETKYHFIAQPINLISPSLSLLYQSYGSPRLKTSQTVYRAMTYFLVDLLVYWVGGSRFFTTRHSPELNQEYILLGLGLNRAVGAVQSFNIIGGHNHLVQFGYTFPID